MKTVTKRIPTASWLARITMRSETKVWPERPIVQNPERRRPSPSPALTNPTTRKTASLPLEAGNRRPLGIRFVPLLCVPLRRSVATRKIPSLRRMKKTPESRRSLLIIRSFLPNYRLLKPYLWTCILFIHHDVLIPKLHEEHERSKQHSLGGWAYLKVGC